LAVAAVGLVDFADAAVCFLATVVALALLLALALTLAGAEAFTVDAFVFDGFVVVLDFVFDLVIARLQV
jgi:hypothetical protein